MTVLFYITLIFLAIYGHSVSAQCLVNSSWGSDNADFFMTRHVDCTSWVSGWEGSRDSSLLTFGVTQTRTGTIDPFAASLEVSSIAGVAINKFTFYNFLCSGDSLQPGDTARCNTQENKGQVLLNASLYLPTDSDLNPLPTSWYQYISFTLFHQSDMSLTFTPLVIALNKQGVGCSRSSENYYCGYSCNPQLINFQFDRTYSANGQGGRSLSIKDLPLGPLVTFSGSRGKDVTWGFKIITYQPTADDCSNPPTHVTSAAALQMVADGLVVLSFAVLLLL